ncbi:MAG TPA: methyl-accepting chemotaxis protein, partial [Telluria sp.]|nr:methyl-accepting chemotaxis protein [Telluria sp.]
MTYLQSSKARLAIAAAVAAATSTLLVFLINLIVPGALGPVSAALLAALAGVLVFSLAAKGNEAEDSRQFIRVVGHSIDDIMIGAAETSYFVDSVKKKIEKDVQTAGEMVVSAEQVARTTERIAANAERAAKVAAQVRSESVAGRAEVDQGLQRISSARGDARQAAANMAALQEKSKSIAGFIQVITEI